MCACTPSRQRACVRTCVHLFTYVDVCTCVHLCARTRGVCRHAHVCACVGGGEHRDKRGPALPWGPGVAVHPQHPPGALRNLLWTAPPLGAEGEVGDPRPQGPEAASQAVTQPVVLHPWPCPTPSHGQPGRRTFQGEWERMRTVKLQPPSVSQNRRLTRGPRTPKRAPREAGRGTDAGPARQVVSEDATWGSGGRGPSQDPGPDRSGEKAGRTVQRRAQPDGFHRSTGPSLRGRHGARNAGPGTQRAPQGWRHRALDRQHQALDVS